MACLDLSLDPLAFPCEALCSATESFSMRKVSVFMRALLKYFTICIGFRVILGFILSFFAKVFAVSHFDGGLALRLSHTIIQDQGMFVLDLEFGKFLADQSLDLLEYLYVVLSYQCNSFASFSSPSCSADAMNVILRVGRDVIIDDNIDGGYVKTA